MKILARIKWFYFSVIILIGLTLKIIFYPLLPRPKGSKLASHFILAMTFTRLRVIGEADPRAQMFVMNHQSEFDIALMECLSAKDLAWVAKKELFEIPFFSLALRTSNDIPLEREAKAHWSACSRPPRNGSKPVGFCAYSRKERAANRGRWAHSNPVRN